MQDASARPLLPHQVDGFNAIRQRRTVALLWDMRLGKTLLTLRWLRARGCRYVLVVCPLLVMLAWREECEAEGIRVHDFRKPRFEDLEAPGMHVCLINYDLVWRRPTETFWDAVVLDESTAIRNPKSKVAKYLLKAFQWVEHRAILTGMPTPGTFLDLWNQLAFVNGGEWMGCRNFYDWRFRNFYEAGFNWEPRPDKLPAINAALREDAITLTKQQAGVGNAKIRSVRCVPAPAAIKKASARCLEDFALGDEETKWTMQVSTWLHQLSGGCHPEALSLHKFPALEELLVRDGLERTQGLIFCNFTREADTVVKWLNGRGITAASLQGRTSPETRKRWLRMFNAGTLRVLVCKARVVKFGINLSKADWAIYFSNTYDPEDRFQSEERGVHPLKKEPFFIVDIVTEGLVDEHVRDLLLNDKLLTGRSFMSKLFVRLKAGKETNA